MLFAGQPIPKSPFEVNVDKALGDASKVTVKGPGIEPVGNIANKPTYFDIFTAGQRRQSDLRGRTFMAALKAIRRRHDLKSEAADCSVAV